ncbi:hypothetical protein [Roseibium sp.]|uniref:hypothetical protein n=1 Tax=Roseibium sp. TaxID=1936156 RepID=UPI003B52028F
MKAAPAKKPMRDTIRDTLTPSRVGLLSWAFAALAMGTVGMASYKFSSTSLSPPQTAYRISGIQLPPDGDVTATGSIRSGTRGEPIEVLRLPGETSSGTLSALEQSQITVLQEQIARLRRRLSTMSAQNDAYSRRLAALEAEIANPAERASGTKPGAKSQTTASFLSGSSSRELADASHVKRPMAPLPKPTKMADASAAKPALMASAETMKDEQAAGRRPASRRINLHTGQRAPELPIPASQQAPVKIVQLPPADTNGSLATGSIPQQPGLQPLQEFDSTPASTTLRPKVIAPSDAAGTLRGGGRSTLKRSDFGAIVGHFSSLAEAANAWSKFKEQNEERMRDLRPLIKNRSAQGGVSLLVGPFGNAADAAAACFYLLDVTDLCQPALYAGAPMIAASDFPQTTY